MAERIAIRFEGSTGGAFVGGEPAQPTAAGDLQSHPQRGASLETRRGGRPSSGDRRRDGPPHLSHGALRPGPYVCLTVVDAGCGMDEETRARIFEPFFTTRPAGTGLGLATAFEFVDEQGGAFNVRSAPGEAAPSRPGSPSWPVRRRRGDPRPREF